MKDLIISCIQCNRSFIFTVREQERALSRGFSNPKRCPECRNRKERTPDLQIGWRDKNKKKPHHHKLNMDLEED
ncbi:MAG: zinc-ribbon domain containing protein [Thermodesulfobacteriota bacterium]